MNPTNSFDQILHEWLVDAAPHTMPAATHSGAIDRARRTKQRSSWSAALHGWAAGQGVRAVGLGRVARVGALVAATALIGIMLASGLGQRPPTPIESPAPSASPTAVASPVASPTVAPLLTTEFARPFSYVLPTDNSIRTVLASDSVFEFIDGSLSGRHGILVAVIDQPYVHACPVSAGRILIRKTPAGLLEDLGAIGGLTLTAPSETIFDGRVATVTRRAEYPITCATGDLHIDGGGLGSDFISLSRPASMILSEVDGRTVLIDIWAVDDVELESWLPTAMEFVDSIRFGGPAIGTASDFARPFSFAVPSGVSPLWVSRDVDLYGFVDSTREIQPNDFRYGPAQAISPRGIALVSVSDLSIPVCRGIEPGRVDVRNNPAGFLDDLDATGGLELGPITSTVVDGLPALTTELSPATSACTAELKVGPGVGVGGLSERYVATEPPSQFFVFEVQGTTILVDVWTQTDSELEAWLPIAMDFVNSLNFAVTP